MIILNHYIWPYDVIKKLPILWHVFAQIYLFRIPCRSDSAVSLIKHILHFLYMIYNLYAAESKCMVDNSIMTVSLPQNSQNFM